MAKILDKDSKTVILKLTITEYNKMKKSGITFDNSSDYEVTFDTPILAKELLKSF